MSPQGQVWNPRYLLEAKAELERRREAELEEEDEKYDAMVADQEVTEEGENSLVDFLLKRREEEEEVRRIEEDKQVYTVCVPFTGTKEGNKLSGAKEEKYVFIGDEKFLYTGNEEIPWEASDGINPTASLNKVKKPSNILDVPSAKIDSIGEPKIKIDNPHKDDKPAKVRKELTEITIEGMKKKVAQEEIEEDDGIEIVTTVSKGSKASEMRDLRAKEVFRRQKSVSYTHLRAHET